MSKLRVHEIARELDKSNKEVMDFLKSKNIDVKSHMSSLEDDHVSLIRANLTKGKCGSSQHRFCKTSSISRRKTKEKADSGFQTAECKSYA